MIFSPSNFSHLLLALLLSTQYLVAFSIACPPAAPWPPPPGLGQLGMLGFENRFPTRSIADGVVLTFPCRLPQTVGFTMSLNSTAPRFPVEKLSGGGENGRHVFPRPAILRSNNQRAIIRTTGRTSSFHLPILSGDCGFTLAPRRGLPAFPDSERLDRDRDRDHGNRHLVSVASAASQEPRRVVVWGGGRMLPDPAGDELRSAEQHYLHSRAYPRLVGRDETAKHTRLR